MRRSAATSAATTRCSSSGEGTRSFGDPVSVSRAGIAEARAKQYDVVIVDTAGRLAVDAVLMQQAADIRAAIQPDEVLFVIDAMIGQAAVETALAFQEGVDFTGVVLSKLDGDARGGAALSVAGVTGRPIMYSSTGENTKDFEVFHPDRMAGRILDMGDVLTLIEQAEKAFDQRQADEMARKFLAEEDFTFDDFLQQMSAIKKMGSLKAMLKMMPGMQGMRDQLDSLDEREFDRVEAMVRSMTPVRAVPPQAHRRLAPLAHRQGLGRDGVGGQPAAGAVPRGAEDDEVAGPRWRRRPAGDAGHAGRAQGAAGQHPCSARSPRAATRPSAPPTSAPRRSGPRARGPRRPARRSVCRRRVATGPTVPTSTPPTSPRASRSSWVAERGPVAEGPLTRRDRPGSARRIPGRIPKGVAMTTDPGI